MVLDRVHRMIWAAASAALFLLPLLAAEPKPGTTPVSDSISPFAWSTNLAEGHSVTVRSSGKISKSLADAGIEKIFTVQVEQADIRSAIGLPAMVGKYEVSDAGITFRPQFPFQPGVKYRATLFPASGKPLTSVFEMTKERREPSTTVVQIYPTADTLPENLLKFYLYFSAPMSGGHIYEHIHLINERGEPVELPFLEIDEELWNPEMTRLTLFLDPGRIKREVQPLEEIGPALQAGKAYVLRIDAGWHDATGTPLKQTFEKRFRVAEPDRSAPDLSSWKMELPKAETRDALKVTFTDPMDHALAARMIAVTSVAGEAQLSEKETVWQFTPREPWRAGEHRLAVQSTIEDLAGNNIGKPFEVDLFSDVQKRITRETVERKFTIQ